MEDQIQTEQKQLNEVVDEVKPDADQIEPKEAIIEE